MDVQITHKYSKLLAFFISALKIVDCSAENSFQHASFKSNFHEKTCNTLCGKIRDYD